MRERACHRGNQPGGDDLRVIAAAPAGDDGLADIPFVPAKAGTQSNQLQIYKLTLDSRLRGNERSMSASVSPVRPRERGTQVS
jgi:hypothetical protein